MSAASQFKALVVLEALVGKLKVEKGVKLPNPALIRLRRLAALKGDQDDPADCQGLRDPSGTGVGGEEADVGGYDEGF